MLSGPEIYHLKVRLLGISPMVWRRVLIPALTTLRELHGILQVALGWEGIHLFLFDIHAARYGSFELHAANPDVGLQEFGFRKNERFSYIYDMGDHWEHEIRIEAINSADDRSASPDTRTDRCWRNRLGYRTRHGHKQADDNARTGCRNIKTSRQDIK